MRPPVPSVRGAACCRELPPLSQGSSTRTTKASRKPPRWAIGPPMSPGPHFMPAPHLALKCLCEAGAKSMRARPCKDCPPRHALFSRPAQPVGFTGADLGAALRTHPQSRSSPAYRRQSRGRFAASRDAAHADRIAWWGIERTCIGGRAPPGAHSSPDQPRRGFRPPTLPTRSAGLPASQAPSARPATTDGPQSGHKAIGGCASTPVFPTWGASLARRRQPALPCQSSCRVCTPYQKMSQP